MCHYKCQASRVFDFLVSRSLLSPKWSKQLDHLRRRLYELQLRLLAEAANAEARDLVKGKASSNDNIDFSDIDTILEMLIRGPDGQRRRWWIFGAYTSPLIQGLSEIKNQYSTQNLEQAELCQKLRSHVLELRDLHRDQVDKRNSLLDIAERIHANLASIERDKTKYADLQNQYGFSDAVDITKDELNSKVQAFIDRQQSENQHQLREILRNPSLQTFVRDYNERHNRHLKIEGTGEELIFVVEELLYYARVTEEISILDILRDAIIRIVDSKSADLQVVEDVWKLRERILLNKTTARLIESESKLRVSLAENDRRIQELQQLVRETARIAQESVGKIFPQGIEIVID